MKIVGLRRLGSQVAALKTGVAAPAPVQRANSNARGYNYRWRMAALRFLRRHPLCAECQRQGRVTAATAVDHIIPHKGDMALFWKESNFQGLCAPCHGRKTAAEDGGWANPLR